MINKMINMNTKSNKELNLKTPKYIGVVGSGNYKEKLVVLQILNEFVFKDMVIVSGHSPRNTKEGETKGDNVDIWAEDWGLENCLERPWIYHPQGFTRDAFFARNKLIADKSDVLFVFINRGQYKSGAWNTLKWFLIKQRDKQFKQFTVFDQDGIAWINLPTWTRKYLD